MTVQRPVLLGMNNPQSADPRHVLYPHPPGCAGHRLMTMMLEAAERHGIDWIAPADYKEGFEKINLLNSVEWNTKEARQQFHTVEPCLWSRRIIICGATVPKIVGVHFQNWCEWDVAVGLMGSFEFCVIPHPSGRCREYNEEGMKREVGNLLLNEYLQYANDLTLANSRVVSSKRL